MAEVSAGQYKVHIYQCRNCKTVLAAGIKARYGEPYICPLDRCWMTFLYSESTNKKPTGLVINPKPGDI